MENLLELLSILTTNALETKKRTTSCLPCGKFDKEWWNQIQIEKIFAMGWISHMQCDQMVWVKSRPKLPSQFLLGFVAKNAYFGSSFWS